MTTAKPILMSAPMVLALLREIEAPGTGKTQTRRIIKPQPEPQYLASENLEDLDIQDIEVQKVGDEYIVLPKCPYGKPGDLLYVRETFRLFDHADECGASDWCNCPKTGTPIYYASAGEQESKWTPSIHMPRQASRLTLEITDVRAERLQDISEEDAKAEGVFLDEDRPEEHDYEINSWMCPKCAGTRIHDDVCPATLGVIHDVDCRECETSKQKYRHLWNAINGPESWSRNDWVWVVTFKPHLINVDQFIKARAA
ncbi:MAG: hypothetical protein Unbinned664contig1000_68 [Prokaryotic dsDNA virus sp.]|nr:MAG: hypothetical protein Unbinned664contig1000_68 [Prokaryotic dsDNA virus sp.]|tara:strand:- start:17816 stop:18583 length:768 start_codon:yes stop_codon:yes gene_type:complete